MRFLLIVLIIMVSYGVSPANKGQDVAVRAVLTDQENTSVIVTTSVVGSPSSASDVRMSSKDDFRMEELNFRLE